MSTTLLSNSRGHPSVLQLLPFSKNDAVPVHRDSMTSQTQMTYCNEIMPDIPILVTMAAKSRTRNVSSPTNNKLSSTHSLDSIPIQRPKPRIIDIHSDKLPERHSEHSENRDDLNTKREAHLRDTTVSGTFRLSLNEVSIKTKDRSRDDSHNMTFAESKACSLNVCKDMVKSLPKPTFKPTDYRLLHRSDKYFKNLKTTDVKEDTERHNRELFQTDPGYQHTGRIKLNVKELHRSKTPISENDPDKLNMKHVIVFLQSSNKVVDDSGYDKICNKTQVKSQSHCHKMMSLSSSPSAGDSCAFFDQKQHIVKPSHILNRVDSSQSSWQPSEITQQNHHNSGNMSYNGGSNKPRVQDSYYLDIARRQSSCDGKTQDQHSDGLMFNQHWDKPTTADMRDQHLDQHQGLKSLDIAQPAAEVSNERMPPITCKHQAKKTDKPFQLHRVVPHLPDVSARLTNVSHNSLNDHDACFQKNPDTLYRVPSLEKAEKHSKSADRLHAEATHSKSADRLHAEATHSKSADRLHAEATHYKSAYRLHVEATQSMSCAGHSNDSRPERRSNLKCVPISSADIVPTLRTTKVICLPSVHIEGESDEDISSVLTVGSRESIKDPHITKAVYNFNNIDKKTRSDKRNSVTDEKSLTSYSYQETYNKAAPEETCTKSPSKTVTATSHTYYEHDTINKQMDPESSDLRDKSETRQQTRSPAFIKESQTRMEASPNSFQLNAHQKTFIRLLNQELAAMKRTVTWQERHHHLFSPLVYENKMPNWTRNPANNKEQVKLSLRKERNKTRVHTYMTDMEERRSVP